MLPRDSLGLLPVARPAPATAAEALGDPRQQALQRALAGQLGKAMQGQVLARLSDGSAIVRVADTPARMMLPVGAEVGSEVPLTLVALHPRPTFELHSGDARTLLEASPAPPAGDAPTAASAAPADEAAVFTPHGQNAPLLYRPDGRAPALPDANAPSAPHEQTGPALYRPDGRGAGPADHAATPAPQAQVALAYHADVHAPAAASGTAAPARTNAGAPGMPLPSAAEQPGAALSPTGQVLGSVLAAVLRLPQPARAMAARAPVLPGPAADAAHIAPALRQALEHSGLFYESHVAEWARGQRDLAALASEPQMQARPPSPTDPDTAQLINLQLSAQEQDRVAWEGLLWPGQPLQWEISRDAPQQERASGEHPEPAWRSRLRLRFPLLGELDATVVLHGGQLAISVALPGEDGAALLRAHAATLAGALAAAGTPLASLSVTAGAADE